MAVGLSDAPEIGEKLARLSRVQHLRQLAGDHAYVGAHPGAQRMVRRVDQHAHELRREIGRPSADPVDGALPLRSAERLVRQFQDGDKQQRDLMDAVGDEAEAQQEKT
ncbi:MAG: hypothetical protein AAF170_08340 [Bacteroidota bacterium]